MEHTRIQYFGIGSRSYKDYGSILGAGAHLKAGQGLVSNNERYAAVLRNEGDLHVYNMNTGASVWNSGIGSWDQRDRFIVLQETDGHLVIYNGATGGYGARWWNNVYCDTTDNKQCGTGWTLIMQDDGNLVVYDADMNFKWHSGSHGKALSDIFNIAGNESISDGKSIQIGINLLYILIMLMVINFLCVGFYCFNKNRMNKRRNFKIVSMV